MDPGQKSFPPPLSLPSHISEARASRYRGLIRASKIGIVIRSFIIAAELLGFLVFHSSALLVDGLATLVDVTATLVLIACMTLARRPPDEDHPFGHGRYETLAGLQLSLLLCVIGAVMLIQQGINLFRGSYEYVINPNAWMIPFVSVILLEGCYHMIMRTAKKENSVALKAEAYHYRIDALNSIFAVVALATVAFLPQWSAAIDRLGAIAIAIMMIGTGVYVARDNLYQLIDHSPAQEVFDIVTRAAMRVDGVLGTEKTRIQQYGPDAHVNIDIEVDPDLSVKVAHDITQKVRIEIQRDWPSVRDVIVHTEPYYPDDH